MDWQPIETAPRDGTVVLVTDGERFAAATAWDYTEPASEFYDHVKKEPIPNPKAGQIVPLWLSIGCSAWSEDTEYETYDGTVSILRPTHWMPLPPPPEQSTKQR